MNSAASSGHIKSSYHEQSCKKLQLTPLVPTTLMPVRYASFFTKRKMFFLSFVAKYEQCNFDILFQ